MASTCAINRSADGLGQHRARASPSGETAAIRWTLYEADLNTYKSFGTWDCLAFQKAIRPGHVTKKKLPSLVTNKINDAHAGLAMHWSFVGPGILAALILKVVSTTRRHADCVQSWTGAVALYPALLLYVKLTWGLPRDYQVIISQTHPCTNVRSTIPPSGRSRAVRLRASCQILRAWPSVSLSSRDETHCKADFQGRSLDL